ncbi:MAG: hypothetical protein M1819_003089 [Sarea resinae]|nr:MAG: hypothetical protein M1819_003089 [Sarea resinae]
MYISNWDARPQRAVQRYDEHSGQVFSEVTSSVPRARDRNWEFQTRGAAPRLGVPRGRKDSGADKLESMAMRCLLRNLANLTPEVLKFVPWSMGERILAAIRRAELISLHTWKLFTLAYPVQEAISFYDRTQSVPIPLLALDNYVTAATSKSFGWITFLAISDVSFPRPELVNLSKLTNLGVVEICSSPPPPRSPESAGCNVDDAVIRAWGRSASESGALPKLQTVILRNQRGMTFKSLRYLRQIPSLKYLVVTGPKDTADDHWTLSKIGWQLVPAKAAVLEEWGRRYISSNSRNVPILHLKLGNRIIPPSGEELYLRVSKNAAQSTKRAFDGDTQLETTERHVSRRPPQKQRKPTGQSMESILMDFGIGPKA